ncbi:MAG: hypothetical protein FJ290_08150 [Planctomycetes bacterium]|nr:hypothetical protein [Planctomycetota bacterium]
MLHQPGNPQASAPWKGACAIVALCFAVMLVAAILLPHPAKPHGSRLVLCLLAIESLLLAVAAPFLAARESASWLLSVLLPLVAIVSIGVVLCAIEARGDVLLPRVASAHVFLLAFAWLLAALTVLLRTLRFRPSAAQLLGTLVALAMLGQVFFVNALVEAAPGQSARMLVIDASLWTNPWLIVGGSILEADPLRSEKLYESSVLIYYGFRYPASAIASVHLRALLLTGVYAACAAAVQALSCLLRRRRWA